MNLLRSSWLAALGIAVTVGPAVAAGPAAGAIEVRVPVLEVEGEIAAPDVARLEIELRAGLERAGFAIAEADAQRTVRATVRKQGSDFAVELELIEGSEVVVSVQDTCDLCGIRELSDLVVGAAGRLRQRLSATMEPADIVVDSEPRGAAVIVDGEVVGTTPLATEVAAGKHSVVVSTKGYRDAVREVDLEGGTHHELAVTLARRGVRTWLPWTVMAVGVAGAGAGAALLVLHGQPIRRDCQDDALGNCRYLHKTQPGGIALVAAGGALVIAGIALAVAWRRPRSARSRVARLHPARAGVALEF